MWESFTAQSVLQQAKTIMREHTMRSKHEVSLAKGDAAEGDAPEPAATPKKRKASAIADLATAVGAPASVVDALTASAEVQNKTTGDAHTYKAEAS